MNELLKYINQHHFQSAILFAFIFLWLSATIWMPFNIMSIRSKLDDIKDYLKIIKDKLGDK